MYGGLYAWVIYVHARMQRSGEDIKYPDVTLYVLSSGSLPEPGAELSVSEPHGLLGSSLTLPTLELQAWESTVSFSCGCWGLNLGIHACTTSRLPSEPSPQPHTWHLVH